MQRTHEDVLGVPPAEASHRMRTAFRSLALHHHPERLGGQRTAAFAELLRAFAALSGEKIAVSGARKAIASRQSTADLAFSVPDDLPELSPRTAEIVDWLRRNFEDRTPPKSARVETVRLGLTLDEELTRRDILRITWGFPVWTPCSLCQGSGYLFGGACRVCQATGLIEQRQWVALDLAPRSPDASAALIPVEPLGIVNTRIEVRLLSR